jgi:hypothetical protein
MFSDSLHQGLRRVSRLEPPWSNGYADDDDYENLLGKYVGSAQLVQLLHQVGQLCTKTIESTSPFRTGSRSEPLIWCRFVLNSWIVFTAGVEQPIHEFTRNDTK